MREGIERVGHIGLLTAWSAAAAVLGALVCATAPADGAEPGPLVRTHRAMATEWSITAYPREGERVEALGALLDEMFEGVDQLERVISEWKPDSQTSYVNNHAAEGPVRVATDLMDLLVASKDFYERTGGAFDVTVGPLSKLYGFYDGRGHVPTAEELSEALGRVGMNKVKLDRSAGTVRFETAGMRLDFGGVGKGFAIDRAVAQLRARGITRALLSAGTSSVYAMGTPPGEPGWKVHIRHPYNEGESVATLTLADESLSTSGCYGNLPEVDGVGICNVFDPRTGQARHGIVSASAIAPTATETEALGKAFLILGVDEARKYCERNPGRRAILVPEAPGIGVNVVWIGPQTGP